MFAPACSGFSKVKHLSRRDFVHAGCTVAAATLTPSIIDKAEAYFPHGVVASTVNNNRVTINPDNGYANLAKGFTWNVDPTNQSSDGYPVTTPSVAWLANISMPAGYYGNFVWKWSGQGSQQLQCGPAICVSTNTTILPSTFLSNGDFAGGSLTIIGQSAPRTVLAFGWNIQSISQGTSNGSGGFLIRVNVKSGYLALGGGNGSTIQIAGCNSNTGANNTGTSTWTITNSTPASAYFELAGSLFTNAQASAAGQAYYAAINLDLYMYNSGTFSGMSNLVWCESANETPIANGQIVDPVLVTQLQTLMGTPGGVGRGNPGWLRFMNQSQVLGSSFEGDFAQRCPSTYLYYPASQGQFRNGYWVGSITNGGSDAYTCSNPSFSTSSGWTGAYQDGEIVQGQWVTTNTGVNPTIAVGGRATVPIFNQYFYPQLISFSQPAGGQTVASGTYNSGTGAVSLTLAAGVSGATIASGDSITVTLTGTGSVATINGAYTATAGTTGTTVNFTAATGLTLTITGGTFRDHTAGNGLTIAIQFSAPWTSPQLHGGTPYVFTYTTSTSGHFGDDTVFASTLAANIDFAIGNDATLAAGGIDHGNAGGGQVIIVPQPAQAGALTITYSSGPNIYTIIRINPSAFTSGHNVTLIYKYLLGGFVLSSVPGLLQSLPYEWIAQLCNQVNANCWYNFGDTKGAFVTAVTNFFAPNSGNFNSGLKFGFEPWNEIWDSAGNPVYGFLNILGEILSIGNVSSNSAVYSYAALRTVQYSALARAAWASGGGVANNFYVFQPSQVGAGVSGASFDQYQLQGANLNYNTKTVLASYGGLNGVAGSTAPVSTNYAASPNRPIDITNATGCAPYWGCPFLGGNDPTASNINGTVAQNATMLAPALNYANGSTATAFAEMVSMFTTNVSGPSGSGLAGFEPGGYYVGTIFPQEETLCASYDNSVSTGVRYNSLPNLAQMHYEGGPQWGCGVNGVNGINSVNAADIAALAARFIALGWGTSSPNLSSYTLTGNPTVSSGTYNSGTGQVVLTLATAIADSGATDSVVMSLTGTGSISSLNGTFTAAITNGGITVTYTAATGLTVTITGGTVLDITAGATELATKLVTLWQAWKYDASYGNFIQTYYYAALTTISGANRETRGAQYLMGGQNQWCLWPGGYSAPNQYTSYNAIANYNA